MRALNFIDYTLFSLYIQHTHSFCLQRNNELFNGKPMSLMLRFTITDAGNGYDILSLLCLNLLWILPRIES